MKPQDILFVIIFVALLFTRKPNVLVWVGLVSLALAIPLFAGWVFFTAERLTWYAAAFFGAFVLISTFSPRTVQ